MRHLPPRGARAAVRLAAALFALAAAGVPAGAQQRAPQVRSPYEQPATKAERVRRARAQAARLAQRQSAVTAHESITEAEPNDTATTATRAAIGDVVSGLINPIGDEDWFAVDLPAGVRVMFDIDAQALGSPFDAVLGLFAPDGRTVITVNDDFEGLDSRIVHTVGSAGRYYIAVADLDEGGAATYRYELRITTLPTGPGDGTTLFATGLGSPTAMAAAPDVVWVADRQSPWDSRILRVTNTGVVTAVAQGPRVGYPLGIAVDGVGDLLVAGIDSLERGHVLRISTTGQVSTFNATGGFPLAITVGPDGDVWVADDSARAIRRFDPTGVPKGVTSLGSAPRAWAMAFSPAGELHFVDAFDGVYRLTTGGPVKVITRANHLDALAFDAVGRLYVANGFLGTIALFSATYQPIAEPFATTNLGGPLALAFLRDAGGAMTSRLVASNFGFGLLPPWAGGIVEMRAGSVVSPGFRVGTDLLQIANTALRTGLVGAELRDTLRLASGATATWSVASGALPPGITLSSAGVLSGIPEQKGSFEVTVRGTTSSSLGARRFTLVVDEPTLEIAAATDYLMGATGALTPALARFLDLQGNRNGRADIGDLRAYLRTRGMLPTGTASDMITARTGGTTP